MVMELFPKKRYKETVSEIYEDVKKGHIYIGEEPLEEDDDEQEYNKADVLLKQYALVDGTVRMNEIAIIESDSGSLKGYEKVLDYDMLNARCGADFLPAVLIANGKNYAYIYSGSRMSRVGLYRFEADHLRITRLSFDDRFISLSDLRDVISKVFLSEGKVESLLLRSAVLRSEKQ